MNRLARIVPIRDVQAIRRLTVEQSLRDARSWIDAALSGQIPLGDGVFEADAALRPAVREACRAEVG